MPLTIGMATETIFDVESKVVSRAFDPGVAKQATRNIIRIDMDAFYAPVQRRDDPSLRGGRPGAVGHGAARDAVATASYEAQTLSVRSAIVLRKCAELVFVPSHFELYRAVSRQINAILAVYTSLVQPLSPGEAYLDVTENRRGLLISWAAAKEICTLFGDETGLTARSPNA
jgi:DNA polymerase-4